MKSAINYGYRHMAIAILLAGLFGCNPVKRVLHNPDMFDKVAQEVVKRGYCINDTITRDTILVQQVEQSTSHDTLLLTRQDRSIDTLFDSGARLQIDSTGAILLSCPVKTVRQVERVNHYIRDRRLELILQQDIEKRDSIISQLNLFRYSLQQSLSEKQSQINDLKATIRKKNWQLIGLLAILVLFSGISLYRKLRSFLPL